MKSATSIFLIGMIFSTSIWSQSKGIKMPKLELSGGLGINGVLNERFSSDSYYGTPWSYGISGNLNASIGSFRIPISLYFSQNGLNTNVSFNRFGISPSYKGIKLHLGHRSMRFSPYVLNGNTFFGAGLEGTYKKLRFSVMKGKLRNIKNYDINRPIIGLDFLQDYNRNVEAVKVGIGTLNNFFDLILFRGHDDQNLELVSSDLTYAQLPKDNLAFGFNSKFGFGKLSFTANLMGSAYNENQNAEQIDSKDFAFLSRLFKPNVTTQIGYAGRLDGALNLKLFRFGFNVEKVSPQFQTLGRYFNLNDTERARVYVSSSYKGLNINTSYGIEKNEISPTNNNSTIRNIFSLNGGYRVNKSLKFRANFSNFNIDNSPQIIDDDDVLKAVRVSTNASLIPSYKFGKIYKQNVRLSIIYRQFDNKLAFASEKTSTNSYVLKCNYDIVIPKVAKFGLFSSLQRFNKTQSLRENYVFGGNATKQFLNNKLNTSFRVQYAINNINKRSNGSSFSSGLNLSYSMLKKHRLKFSTIYFLRNREIGQDQSEMRSRISYNYAF